MSRVLRAAVIVCIVCTATKSKAEEIKNYLEGTLHAWQASDEVKTVYKEDQRYGNEPAKVSMDGIEKALMVAAELIYDDGRGSMQRIDAFVNNEKIDERNYGHRRYNDGRAASQNFVVMVIKLVKMISDNGAIKRRCDAVLNVNAAGGGARGPWWTCGKNKEHNPIADCNLYIDNFKISEYIKELKGALLYIANPDRKDRNDLSRGGPEFETTRENSHIAAAYQVMARLPYCQEEAVEALEGVFDNIKNAETTAAGEVEAARKEDARKAGESTTTCMHYIKKADAIKAKAESEIGKLKKQRTILQAFLFGTSAIVYDKSESVTTHLVTQMVEAALCTKEETGNTLLYDKLINSAATALRHSCKDSKISRNLYGQKTLYDSETTGPEEQKELTIESSRLVREDSKRTWGRVSVGNAILEGLNAGSKRKAPYTPYRLGSCPEIFFSCNFGEISLARAADPTKHFSDQLAGMLEKAVIKKFSWVDGKGWQALGDDESGASRIYRLRSAVIRSNFPKGAYYDFHRYLTVHWSDDLSSFFIRGKGWLDELKLAATKGASAIFDFGEIMNLYYWNDDPQDDEQQVAPQA